MRHRTSLAFACVLGICGPLTAQELLPPTTVQSAPPPPPAPAPNLSAPPPPAPAPGLNGTGRFPVENLVVPPPASPAQIPGTVLPPPIDNYAPDNFYEPMSFFRRPPADPCNPNTWIGIDSLIWWTKGQPLAVPLITTGPAAQGAAAGAIGAAGTTFLDRPLGFGGEGGLRLYGGGWFDPNHIVGMDASLFFLGEQRTGYSIYDRSGAGNLVINEPVVGAPFITQVSAPGLATGGTTVGATSDLWGFDVNVLYNVARSNGLSINLLGGFSYLQLDERLTVVGDSTLLSTLSFTDNLGNTIANAGPGSGVTMFDRFQTRNQFYGGQVGAQVQYAFDRLFISATGKLAAGNVQEVVTVSGATHVFPTNADPIYYSGGNYATLQTGRYTANRFAWAPQLQLNLGYQFTPFIRGTIGYNFLYLSQVARPGNQIDNVFDGFTRPFVPMTSSSYWAQGINIGVQFGF